MNLSTVGGWVYVAEELRYPYCMTLCVIPGSRNSARNGLWFHTGIILHHQSLMFLESYSSLPCGRISVPMLQCTRRVWRRILPVIPQETSRGYLYRASL